MREKRRSAFEEWCMGAEGGGGAYVDMAMDIDGIAARLALRPQGTFMGQPLTMVVGVLHGELRSKHTLGRPSPHGDELLLGRLLFSPYQRFIGAPEGMDANGLLVRGGLHPAMWYAQVEGPRYEESEDVKNAKLIRGPLSTTESGITPPDHQAAGDEP